MANDESEFTKDVEHVRLRFFRDLIEKDRHNILVEFGALPVDSDERMTHWLENKLFDLLVYEGRLTEMTVMIDALIGVDDLKGECPFNRCDGSGLYQAACRPHECGCGIYAKRKS